MLTSILSLLIALHDLREGITIVGWYSLAAPAVQQLGFDTRLPDFCDRERWISLLTEYTSKYQSVVDFSSTYADLYHLLAEVVNPNPQELEVKLILEEVSTFTPQEVEEWVMSWINTHEHQILMDVPELGSMVKEILDTSSKEEVPLHPFWEDGDFSVLSMDILQIPAYLRWLASSSTKKEEKQKRKMQKELSSWDKKFHLLRK